MGCLVLHFWVAKINIGRDQTPNDRGEQGVKKHLFFDVLQFWVDFWACHGKSFDFFACLDDFDSESK
jgi:hypothetical protein